MQDVNLVVRDRFVFLCSQKYRRSRCKNFRKKQHLRNVDFFVSKQEASLSKTASRKNSILILPCGATSLGAKIN